MKNLKLLALLAVMFMTINGCKKDEPTTQPEDNLKVVEQVAISGIDITNSTASDYTLITSTQTATLDQELDVETQTPYAQLKDNNDNVVAYTYFNYDADDIIISPKETAIAMAIDEFEFFLDLNVFNAQQATDLKDAFYNFDGVQQLETKITQVLEQNGYLSENDLTTELDYLRQKFRDLDLFTETISQGSTAGRNANSIEPSDFTFNSSDFRITDIALNSVTSASNNSYDLSLKIGNASRLVLGIVKGQENNGNFIPNGTNYQYLFTADYEFSFDNIVGILSGNGADLEVRENNPININIDNAYNQLVIVPPALDNTGQIYGANVLSYLLKGIIATIEFYNVAPVSASANTISEYFDNVKADALENITHRIIVEAPQLFQSAQNISGTSIPQVLTLFNDLIVNDIITEEIFNAIESNYATFGGSATLPLTLGHVQTQLEDRFPPAKKATIAGTFVGNFLASMTANIFTNENLGINVNITAGAGIFPEQAHNYQAYYYFDNEFPNTYDLKYSWDAVDPETGTVINDIYYSDVNVTSLFLLASDVSPNEYLFDALTVGNNYYYRIDTKDGINVTTGEPSVLPQFSNSITITGTINNTASTDLVDEATDYVFQWNEIDNSTNETYTFTLYDNNDNVLETHTNLTTNTITLSNVQNYSYWLQWKITTYSDTYEVKSEMLDLLIHSPLASLNTTAITNITSTTATSGGNVVNDGGSDVTARGVCYSTSPNPTTADQFTTDGTGMGTFTSNITGLTANTTYYVRAYATNSEGTAYGNEQNVTTINTGGTGTVTDIDGNTYPTVVIGTQEWMAEDLRVTHYPNGDAIPHITDNTTWGNLADNNIDDAYSFYNNNNTTIYGALYTYSAVIADNWTRDNNVNQGICPDGWRLPSDNDFSILINYLGGWEIAGGKLKEIGTANWLSSTDADNSSGFTALPSGIRDNSNGDFTSLGHLNYWWSSDEETIIEAKSKVVTRFSNNINTFFGKKSSGFSCRCIKD